MQNQILGKGHGDRHELPICNASIPLPHDEVAELIEVSSTASPSPTIWTIPFGPLVELADVDLVPHSCA